VSDRKQMWSGVIFVALFIIGAVAIAHQWGLAVLAISFVIAGVLGFASSHLSNKVCSPAGALRALRAATLANAALMVVAFLMIIAGIIAAGLLWGVWAAIALTIAWILWFSF
jgi:hypothetical protein